MPNTSKHPHSSIGMLNLYMRVNIVNFRRVMPGQGVCQLNEIKNKSSLRPFLKITTLREPKSRGKNSSLTPFFLTALKQNYRNHSHLRTIKHF